MPSPPAAPDRQRHFKKGDDVAARGGGRHRMPDDPREFLKISLSAAVPLWIMEFQRLPFQDVLAIAREAGQVIAEHGDEILFKSKKRGQTAAAFNALAKGIAALSFMPGGVTTFGMHFESKHEGEAVAVATHRPVNLTFEAGTLGRFILKQGLELRWREIPKNPWISEEEPWATEARHYAVDVADNFGKSFSTYYSKGPGHAEPPGLEELLDTVARDALLYEQAKGRIEAYAERVSVDPSDPEVIKEFQELGEQARDLRHFLGDEAYKELLELTGTV